MTVVRKNAEEMAAVASGHAAGDPGLAASLF